MRAFGALAIYSVMAAVAACAVQDGAGRYATQSIGNFDRRVRAEVIHVEEVSLRDASTGGMFIGGVTGGVVASGSDDAGIILVGVLAGMVAGQLIEDAANTHTAMLYTLQSENGAILQAAKLKSEGRHYSVGDQVSVSYGHPMRLDPAN